MKKNESFRMNRVKGMTAETNPHTMQTYQVNNNLDDVT